MSKSKITLFSSQEIEELIKTSHNFSEALSQMGYKQLQDKRIILKLKKECQKYNIDYSHFDENIRVCKICNQEKNLKEYYIVNGKTMYWCKDCQKQKEQEKYKEKTNQIIEYKKTLHCKKCGENRYYLLDFHHRNPNEKKYTISNNTRANFETIKKEIEKCDVLCSNCHREWHYLSCHNKNLLYHAWLGELA